MVVVKYSHLDSSFPPPEVEPTPTTRTRKVHVKHRPERQDRSLPVFNSDLLLDLDGKNPNGSSEFYGREFSVPGSLRGL